LLGRLVTIPQVRNVQQRGVQGTLLISTEELGLIRNRRNAPH